VPGVEAQVTIDLDGAFEWIDRGIAEHDTSTRSRGQM
jgi:hypothetical protein